MEKRIRQQYDIIRELSSGKAFIEGDYIELAREGTEKAYPIIQCSRINLWFFDETREELQCQFNYGGKRFQKGPVIQTKKYPRYVKELEGNRTVAVSNAQLDPRTNELNDDYLIPQNIHAVLDSGLFDGDKLIGIYCLEQAQNPREWTTEDIEFARVLADLFSSAFVLKKRKEAEEALRQSRNHLEESNLTLKNVLSEIENEKRAYMEGITLNIERNVKPLMKDLKSNISVEHQTVIKKLEYQIMNLSSDFYRRLANYNYNLTSTELRICDLIKAGHQGKEIAHALNLSFHTVETHKKNIRKKMGLTGKPMNLKRVLEEIER